MTPIILHPVGDPYARNGDAMLGDRSGNPGSDFGRVGQEGTGSVGSGWSGKSSSGPDARDSGSVT